MATNDGPVAGTAMIPRTGRSLDTLQVRSIAAGEEGHHTRVAGLGRIPYHETSCVRESN
jgi:hypothetical protein